MERFLTRKHAAKVSGNSDNYFRYLLRKNKFPKQGYKVRINGKVREFWTENQVIDEVVEDIVVPGEYFNLTGAAKYLGISRQAMYTCVIPSSRIEEKGTKFYINGVLTWYWSKEQLDEVKPKLRNRNVRDGEKDT